MLYAQEPDLTLASANDIRTRWCCNRVTRGAPILTHADIHTHWMTYEHAKAHNVLSPLGKLLKKLPSLVASH